MKIQSFEFNLFGVNTFVVWDPATSDAAIIDPGMSTRAENERIERFLNTNSLRLTHMLFTHLHIDHTVGADTVRRQYALPVEAHTADAPLGLQRAEQGRMFHMPGTFTPLTIDHPLNEGDTIDIGHGKLQVLHVPGHSPGSIVLYDADGGWVIAGDVIFRGSIGRTDLPGGDMATLVAGIRRAILTLPPSTVIYPGHGAPTTVEREMRLNPFL